MAWWTPATWNSGRRQAPAGEPLAVAHERALCASLLQPLVGGNQVDLLIDGPQTYAAMLGAIDAARDHIHIESYIVDADGPGEEFARRLAARSLTPPRHSGQPTSLSYSACVPIQNQCTPPATGNPSAR